jgi:hypothetical protein
MLAASFPSLSTVRAEEYRPRIRLPGILTFDKVVLQ